MKTLAGIVLGCVCVLCVFSVQSVHAQQQVCTTDADCSDDSFCNGLEACVWSDSDGASVCISGSVPCGASETCDEENDECAIEAGCEVDADCDDGLFCNGDELCLGAECMPGSDPCEKGEVCDEDTGECLVPECERDADCPAGEICRQNMCVDASGCRLTIKPKKVRINTMFRPVDRRFSIKGGEGFDPYAAIDFGPIDVKAAAVNRKGVLKVLAAIPANAGISKGPVRISIGECVGEIMLK